jgi:hypothetical protein
MAVLVKHNVSVVWRMRARAQSVLWLTKESGRVPKCKDPDGCGCAHTELAAAELRRPYLVLAVEYGGGGGFMGDEMSRAVTMAPLQRTSVDVVAQQLAPLLRQNLDRDNGCDVGCVFSLLQGGVWLGAPGCACSRRVGICSACELLRRGGVLLFAGCDSFGGVFPHRKLEWCAGVTDALEEDEKPWLRCKSQVVGEKLSPHRSCMGMKWYTTREARPVRLWV